ncbi:LytR/AlgR family response regulator transcription factor, partial [Lysobacter sp. 2RAB21]
MTAAPLRTLICEDEPLARESLVELVQGDARLELAGTAASGNETLAQIDLLQPTLVLLDIQMPSGTGFDVIDGLDSVPLVVFTTAYDQYAVRAFEANALDYLVKPVDSSRLAAALQRARTRLPEAPWLGAAPRGLLGADDQVFLREGERCWFVALREISRIVVDGNYA